MSSWRDEGAITPYTIIRDRAIGHEVSKDAVNKNVDTDEKAEWNALQAELDRRRRMREGIRWRKTRIRDIGSVRMMRGGEEASRSLPPYAPGSACAPRAVGVMEWRRVGPADLSAIWSEYVRKMGLVRTSKKKTDIRDTFWSSMRSCWEASLTGCMEVGVFRNGWLTVKMSNQALLGEVVQFRTMELTERLRGELASMDSDIRLRGVRFTRGNKRK